MSPLEVERKKIYNAQMLRARVNSFLLHNENKANLKNLSEKKRPNHFPNEININAPFLSHTQAFLNVAPVTSSGTIHVCYEFCCQVL